jgi:GDP-4-dehydro-6-deoxy-D-mannose reductase
MRILVTGITGFAGCHLAEALLRRGGVELFGTSRRALWPAPWRHLQEQVVLRACELNDLGALDAAVRDIQPEQVYHLAGYAHAGQSFRDAEAAWASNLTGTRRLYDLLQRQARRARILYVGSGLVYGDAEDADYALDEAAPLRPTSPYASSKAAADLVSYQYTRAPGLDIVRVRPFNHIGPGQSSQYAVAHFAQQIAAIERGRQPPILETGSLSPQRDLTDVRDMVQAYLLLMERGRTGEVYNAGSGETHSMQEVLDRLLALARVPIEARQQPGLLRATETKVVRSDAGKLRTELGWQPRYQLVQTLADILNYWRQGSG